MRRALALAAMAAAFGPACAARAAAPARIVAQQSIGAGAVELTIATPAFTGPTRVDVFLPAGYSSQPKKRWPVTYYLHGAQGTYARFKAWYGDLIGSFPSIVVSPDGGPVGFYSDWWNSGAGGPPMYETYDIDQLIPLIDSSFRTIAKRAGRALIGESMGGFGVLTYAARHPDLFAAAASLSGFADSSFLPATAVMIVAPLVQGGKIDDIYGSRLSQEVRWRGHNPVDLADNLRDVDLQVRTAEGDPDTALEAPGPGVLSDCPIEAAIYQTNVDLQKQLVALGIPHVWRDYVKGCHSIPNFRREFADSLPQIERVFAHPQPDPSTFSYRSIEPHFVVWGWDVAADPARALEFMQIRGAGRGGLTLAGSGATSVTTPGYFRRARVVLVTTAGGATQRIKPDGSGRLHFTVDLGPADRSQEYTGTAPRVSTRTVTFAPLPRRRRAHRR